MPANTFPHPDRPSAERFLPRVAAFLTVILALIVLAAAFLLISPGPGTYPGSIPWRPDSVLRNVIARMSLGGVIQTVRGSEIKEFVFQLGASLALFVLALRWFGAARRRHSGSRFQATWIYAQVLFVAWFVLAALSALWSGDPALSLGQAAIYAMAVGWAIALAWTLRRGSIVAVLAGLILLSAAAAVLCIWYYHERNPFHRPGFPMGNPSVVAVAIVPAILLCLCIVVGDLVRWFRDRRRPRLVLLIGAPLTLVPLIWAFRLVDSRAAVVGLVAGIAVVALIFVLQAANSRKWILVVLGATFLLGVASFSKWYSERSGSPMARSETIRIRLYMWRYAADLWGQRPILGHGAGAYPRLSGALGVGDRVLDPAAFMSEIDHAHNELFEVLAEIGLVGGVTYVAAWLATFFAALALVRRDLRAEFQWLMLGVIASLAALLADAMFGVALRLPGVPAIHYTLLGVLWAACRLADEQWRQQGELDVVLQDITAAADRPRIPLLNYAAGGVALVAAACVLRLAVVNWSGVRHEYVAEKALEREQFLDARNAADIAERRLLDPVRVLAADRTAAQARLSVARELAAALLPASATAATTTATMSASAPTSGSPALMLRTAEAAFSAADRLGRRIPTRARADVLAAQSAELLSVLLQTRDPEESRRWQEVARQAWLRQRVSAPYDFETLMALTNYATTPADALVLLRDALRVSSARGEWWRVFSSLMADPTFAAAASDIIGNMLRAVGPVGPQTDLDYLVISMAPEVHRLAAAWHAQRGDFDAAQAESAEAAALYHSMRDRLPEQQARALGEQSEYALAQSLEHAGAAVELLRRAIASLPEIQEQQYAAMARPYRLQLARCLWLAGSADEAIAELRDSFPDESESRAALAQQYVELFETRPWRPVREPGSLDPSRQLELLAEALRLDPLNYRARWLTARCAALKGDPAATEAALRATLAAGGDPHFVDGARQRLRAEFPDLAWPADGP